MDNGKAITGWLILKFEDLECVINLRLKKDLKQKNEIKYQEV